VATSRYDSDSSVNDPRLTPTVWARGVWRALRAQLCGTGTAPDWQRRRRSHPDPDSSAGRVIREQQRHLPRRV